MTTQRSKFTREFKLEAISAVVDENRKVKEVADSLNIGISTLDMGAVSTVKNRKVLDRSKAML